MHTTVACRLLIYTVNMLLIWNLNGVKANDDKWSKTCNRQLKFLSTAKSIIMRPCLILSRVVVLFEVGCCVCVVLDGLQSILCDEKKLHVFIQINPLKPKLNPIYYLLALLAHHFLHVSRIRVKSLTFRWLMSYIYIYIYIYIYGAPILDVSRSHTTTQHSR